MVLSEKDIRELLVSGRLAFQPPLVEDKQVGSSAIDLRLGYNFAFYPTLSAGLPANVGAILDQTVDLRDEALVQDFISRVRQANNRRLGDGDSIEIRPGAFLLAETLESFTLPDNLAARVEGRSIYARLGLTVHQTAPTVKPGWAGQLTLEIVNNGPFTYRLYPRMYLCQLILEQLSSPALVSEQSAWGNLRL